MDLAEALKGGLQKIAGENPTDDTEALYKEYKEAKTDADGLRALKQLVKLLK